MRATDALGQFPSVQSTPLQSRAAPILGLCVMLLGATLLLVLPPQLFVAAGLAVTVGLILIVHPRAYLALYLSTGALNLAIFSSQPRALLQSLGGMEPDGLRLLAFTTGALLLLFLRPQLLVMAGGYRIALAFVFVLAASLLYTSSLSEGMRLLLKICFPLFTYLFVIAEVRTEAQIRGLLRACVIGVGCAVVVTIVRVASGDSLYIEDAGGVPRFQGPMGASTMSFYCTAMSLMFYTIGTMRGKRSWPAIFGAIAMGVTAAATGTRVGVAGLLMGLVAVEFVRDRVKRGYLIAGVGMMVAGILTSVFARFAYSRNIYDLAQISFSGGFWGNLAAIDTSGRDMLWRRVWEDLVLTSPLVGHGLGAANAHLAVLMNRPMVPHCEPLRILADTGVIGAALGITLAVRTARALYKTRLPKNDPFEFLGPLAAGAFTSFALFTLTDNILEYYSIFMGYLATFAGLLHVRVRQLDDLKERIET